MRTRTRTHFPASPSRAAAWLLGWAIVWPAAPLAAGEATSRPAVQAECPVMIGNKIDPALFTIHQGKKVYFCCRICKSKFEADPKPYLARLPQFGGTAGSAEPDHDHPAGGFHAAQLIQPMGIATLALVGLTVSLGVLRRRKPRVLLKLHKICGVSALVAGACHATLVLVLH